MRLFVAIELEGPAKQEVLKVVEELSSRHKNAKFVEPENLHFTLKFLGGVDDSRLGDVINAIEGGVSNFKPFRLRVHGMGYFGSRRFAKVVWVGSAEGREEMVKLATELESHLSSFRRDERPPSPHMTICRPKGDTTELIGDVEKERSRDFGFMDVRSIKLKKSALTPKGAVYGDVRIFRLD